MPSNIHVLTTEDCGASWKIIPLGNSIPKPMALCSYNTSLPDWAMAGDAEFRVQFMHKVGSKVSISYMYEIEDPIAYIKEARFLGKMGVDLELSASSIGNRYEMAENVIIDKTLREITNDMSRNLDLVHLDIKTYEAEIEKNAEPFMKKKGLRLSDIAVVVDPDEMTRMAIDTVSAFRIFNSAEINSQGMEIMKARAGAPNITITQSTDKSDK